MAQKQTRHANRDEQEVKSTVGSDAAGFQAALPPAGPVRAVWVWLW
jgi:hypothetical protein